MARSALLIIDTLGHVASGWELRDDQGSRVTALHRNRSSNACSTTHHIQAELEEQRAVVGTHVVTQDLNVDQRRIRQGGTHQEVVDCRLVRDKQ